MAKNSLQVDLAQYLNKQFKKSNQQVAYFLDDDSMLSPTDITGFISTGADVLDIISSNRLNGGIPLGRITQLQGLQGSGKSFISSHIIANVQKRGGIGIYIDTESALSRQFMQVIGVDLNKMIYIHLTTVQDIFDTVQKMITKIRTSDSDKEVVIVIDSLSAASTKTEMEDGYDRDGWATTKSLIIGKAMRKLTQAIAKHKIALVITNQLRTKLGVMFGDNYTTSGGLAVQFHSSLRIRLNKATQIKKGKEVVGLNIICKIVKSRLGPSQRTCEFPLYFLSGINNYESWLTVLKEYKVVGSSSFEFNGNKISYTIPTFHSIVKETEGLHDYFYEKLCECLIRHYVASDGEIDEQVEYTDIEVVE